MKEQLSKRPPKFIGRRAKASRAFAASSLADIQPPTSNRHQDHFQARPWSSHEHTWIHGTAVAVCTKCGKTIPKP